jgi:hypothetical protein
METASQDGSLLVAELTDDAVLRSNLLPNVVVGRDRIIQTLALIDTLCPNQKLVYRRRADQREFLMTEASLDSGERVEITTIGVRDTNGWICTIVSEHGPPAVARQLMAWLATLSAKN